MIFDLPLPRFVKMRNLEENEVIKQDFNEQNSADRLNLNDPTFWSAFARNFRAQVDDDDEKQTSSRIFCDVQNCDASFEEIADYEDHYERKHKHQCLICQKSFTNAHGLEIHFDENHSVLFKVNLTRETGFPRYRCLSDKYMSGYKYTALNFDEDDEGPSTSAARNNQPENNFEEILFKQKQIIRDQDDDLDLVSKSVGTLKNMSYKIHDELEEQNIMLDELGNEMERVDTKLDGVMKKIAKLTNLDDDKRQCKMILILSCLLFFLVLILIII
ncbi:unnamed protein product, partial [Mesorhabditis belari]|uniref:t-SNARE coiled-coil homology domain-containing protein n=1 Tax=Mesorhabditis belari TaxID=2138241 RepID=A0AAF3F7Q5_9BILA